MNCEKTYFLTNFFIVEMKEMSLEEIQKESVQILSKIDLFCCNKGINYSIGYGSLIGAIRHQGFIPWDDDVDIIMTRPNYQRLVELHKEFSIETGLSLYAPELGNCYVRISRITDNSKTVVNKYYQWTDEQTGLWIDVFVIDGVKSLESFHEYQSLFHKCYMTCYSRLALFSNESLLDNCKRLVNSLRCCRWWFVNREKAINRSMSTFDLSYDSCPFVGCYDSPYGDKDIYDKEVFSTYLRMPFENITVSVIANYDKYLVSLYGDYMTLPPVAKRVRGHTMNHYFYK